MEGSIYVNDDARPQAAVTADAAALARRVAMLEAELAHSRQAEAGLRQALGAASVAFLTFNPAGEVLSTSPLLPQLLGLPPQALPGRALGDFLADPLLFDLLLARLQRGEPVREWPAALRQGDGGLCQAYLGAEAVFQDGVLVYGLCFIQDATETLRLRDALQQQALRLSLSERRRDDLLATLGHDLRNRLMVIDASLALMRRGGAEGWNSGSDTIARQAELLNHLVDDLLDAEQLRSGTLALRQERLPLDQLLQRAAQSARRSVDSQAHLIAAEPPSEAATINGDPERLAQALGKLLVHAARNAPGSGGITLGAGREGASAVIWVADDGGHSAPAGRRAELERLLRPTSAQAESPLAPGPGLALTLARRVIELHGGGLEAQGGDGAPGIRFLVRLPLAREEAEPGPELAAGGCAGAGPPPPLAGNMGISRAAAAPQA